MNVYTVFATFLLIRLTSILVVDTWFVPDEYWQSLEVAHKFVYGYGYLTWEWSSGIRNYLYPLCVAAVYKMLNLVGMDYAELLVFAPRFLQALLSAYSDLCFWKWCGKTRWSIFTIGTAWFWYYTGSRTLMNTTETSMTTIALSLFPFQKTKGVVNESSSFIWIVGLMCLIRPTAAVIWTPLCIYQLITSSNTVVHNIVKNYLPIGFVLLVISSAIDSWCYGSFVLTWWEFLKLNVMHGVGDFYGTHPWHWYLSNGLPAILGIQIVPLVIAAVHILRHRKVFVDELWLLGTITFTIFIYSFLGHKEFRFILPLVPISLHLTSQYMSNWSRKANDLLVWIFVGVIFMSNLIPAVFLGHYHQRSPIEVMPHLRSISLNNPTNTSLLFLMPCHSTPLYSHLHVNVTTRFLLCNPNLSGTANFETEVDNFYKSPGMWLRNNYPPNKPLPSHIITFDILVPHVSDILSRYKPILRIFHTNIEFGGDSRVGKFMMVHERID